MGPVISINPFWAAMTLRCRATALFIRSSGGTVAVVAAGPVGAGVLKSLGLGGRAVACTQGSTEHHNVTGVARASAGWGRRAFNWKKGGGVDRAPWLDPPTPQKGLNWRDPQNPTETDPWASEVTQIGKK